MVYEDFEKRMIEGMNELLGSEIMTRDGSTKLANFVRYNKIEKEIEVSEDSKKWFLAL